MAYLQMNSEEAGMGTASINYKNLDTFSCMKCQNKANLWTSRPTKGACWHLPEFNYGETQTLQPK